jgi:LPS sulfotransferase NodH
MKKGILTLSEGRSGSSWLGKLCTQTGVLGTSSEWVDSKILGISHKSISGEEYADRIIEAASTENGFFLVKLFPRHIHWFQLQFGFDLISYLRSIYDVRIVTVERHDQVGQAVSMAKAMQSGAWSSKQIASKAPIYDFDQICRSYFMIRRSYDYWASYLALRNLEFDTFYYEDMVTDPSPFVETVARHAGIADLPPMQNETSIQRNQSTEDWKARFQAEALSADIIVSSAPSRPAKRSLVNLGRFFRKKQMKPGAYAF